MRFFKLLANARFWLSGPVALALSIMFMASMSLWLPAGAAKINHLVIPVVLFPIIWMIAFFYPLIEKNWIRPTIVMLSLLAITSVLVVSSITGFMPQG